MKKGQFLQNARNLKKQLGGRIWEVESVLFKPRAEIRLDCLSHKRGAEIADSSPKQAKRSFFRKANARKDNDGNKPRSFKI